MKWWMSICLIAGLIVGFFVVGIKNLVRQDQYNRIQAAKVITFDTTVYGRSLTTIKHDDHLFVVLTYSGNGACGSVIHSPSCPCLIERK